MDWSSFVCGAGFGAVAAVLLLVLTGALRERSLPHDIDWETGERK